jgi:hypothetical protein
VRCLVHISPARICDLSWNSSGQGRNSIRFLRSNTASEGWLIACPGWDPRDETSEARSATSRKLSVCDVRRARGHTPCPRKWSWKSGNVGLSGLLPFPPNQLEIISAASQKSRKPPFPMSTISIPYGEPACPGHGRPAQAVGA